MLKINGVDLEFQAMGKSPTMGYADEYVEKTMISGKVRRIYKGKRFYATFSYAFLTPSQKSTINEILASQRQNGYVNVQISTPYGEYTGQAIIEVNQDQTRFAYNEEFQDYLWINWQMTLKGVNYAN